MPKSLIHAKLDELGVHGFLELKYQGMTDPDVLEHLGFSRNSHKQVASWRADKEIDMRSRGDLIQPNKMKEWIDDGLSVKQMADLAGVPYPTMHGRVQKYLRRKTKNGI